MAATATTKTHLKTELMRKKLNNKLSRVFALVNRQRLTRYSRLVHRKLDFFEEKCSLVKKPRKCNEAISSVWLIHCMKSTLVIFLLTGHEF